MCKDILIRFTLVKITGEKYYLLATYHHIIMDGWSTNLWLKDFLDIYYNMKKDKDRGWKLRPLRQLYPMVGGARYGGGPAYWRNYLAGFERATQLQVHEPWPTAGGNMPEKSYQETAAGLTELANRLGVTLNTVLQAIWGVVLNRHTAEEDIVFGNVISGRSIPLEGVEHIAGLFINTIPLRIKINHAQKFEDLVRETGENFIESQSYGYLSLAEVQAQAPQAGQGWAVVRAPVYF